MGWSIILVFSKHDDMSLEPLNTVHLSVFQYSKNCFIYGQKFLFFWCSFQKNVCLRLIICLIFKRYLKIQRFDLFWWNCFTLSENDLKTWFLLDFRIFKSRGEMFDLIKRAYNGEEPDIAVLQREARKGYR